MKKVVSILLIVVLALSVAACGAKQVNLSMVTGGTGGTYYAYGGVIANVLTEAVENVTITASTSGASVANARSINNKDADLAILQNDVFDYAYRGVLMFEEEGALTNVATIGTLYPEIIQIVATEASGIKTVADLAGKRVSIGDVGSGTEANATQILEAYGMTVDDLGKCEHLGFADSSTAIQNLTLDAAFVTAGVPNPAIIELNATVDVNLVPIDADKAAALIAKYPFYANYSIADTDYEGIAGVDTVTILATLACSKDLDEDAVYTITKALFENQAKLAEGHAKGAALSAQAALSGVSVPFHPGAEKYYKEIGLK